MRETPPPLFRCCLVWGIGAILLGACLPASAAQVAISRETTVAALEKRKAEQVEAAKASQVFYNFQFVNRVRDSGVTFLHEIVDDAGRDYKPVHYDHGNGLAVADVDGDGRPDIYFTTQLGGNELWRNLGNGKFQNITSMAGVELKDQISVAAAFADVDNDGLPDLFVTTVRHGNHLFHNLGGGRFRDITTEAGLGYSGHSSGAVFFDFDNDGLLDLLVCNVGKYTNDKVGRGGYYVGLKDAFSGHLFPDRTEFSLLYKNLGGLKFKDVTKEMGLQIPGWHGDATFVDLNGDRFPDLYLVNMQGRNRYLENQGGKGFVDKTAAYFPKTPWGAMGVKFFDFNQDGLMDLFVTDMHSDMASLQTKQALGFRLAAEKGKSETYCLAERGAAFFQTPTDAIFGNAFYKNLGQGRFSEVSEALNVETYWPWGVSVGDLNADGFEDIFVTAGMGFPFRYAINSVLLNESGAKFLDSEFLLGVEPRLDHGELRIDKTWLVLDCSGADKECPQCVGKTGRITVRAALSSRSSVMVDLDDDGDLDIVTNDFDDRPQVLISDLTSRKSVHFLKVKLVGTRSNRDGLGATVKVRAGGRVLTQSHDGKSGYLAQSSLPLYFGLGEAAQVESVEVLWPAGGTQSVSQDLPVNGLLTITEQK